jgi:TolB-like protein
MSEPSPAAPSTTPEEVRLQLERILGSQALAGSDQLKRLLRLVVERELSGHPELLKEYNLGLEVFHRPPDYDPKVDPIVRVQARRLRSKLDEYYAGEGANDPVVIQIPKGAYIPVFSTRESVATPSITTQGVPSLPVKPWRPRRLSLASAGAAVLLLLTVFLWTQGYKSAGSADSKRGVAVLPLEMFTEGGNRGHIADQVAEVLTTELAKSSELRVLSRTTASRYRNTTMSLPDIAQSLRVRWMVEGGVGVEGTRAYVKLRCVDSLTDRKIWADVFDSELSDLVAVNTRAADAIEKAILAQLRTSSP